MRSAPDDGATRLSALWSPENDRDALLIHTRSDVGPRNYDLMTPRWRSLSSSGAPCSRLATLAAPEPVSEQSNGAQWERPAERPRGRGEDHACMGLRLDVLALLT